MPNAAEIDTPEAELSSQELRETAAGLLTEADAMDARAAIAAQRAARKATPGKMSAREISENIQVQMDLRRERNNKRKRDAMDRPTVNMQALEIIRKRTEPSTEKDSGLVPTGDAPNDETNFAPDISPSAEGSPPATAPGITGGAGGNAGVLQQEANGVEAGTDSAGSGPDGSGGEDSPAGAGSEKPAEQSFLS